MLLWLTLSFVAIGRTSHLSGNVFVQRSAGDGRKIAELEERVAAHSAKLAQVQADAADAEAAVAAVQLELDAAGGAPMKQKRDNVAVLQQERCFPTWSAQSRSSSIGSLCLGCLHGKECTPTAVTLNIVGCAQHRHLPHSHVSHKCRK